MTRVGTDRHIVLIGLPGAGKTTTGRRLAKLLPRPFADADEYLELSIGTTLSQLCREQGETELRRLESEILLDLLSRDQPLVVSAGGGTQIEDEHRDALARSAIVVWTRGSIRFLAELSDPAQRPRLADGHEVALTRLDRELAGQYAEIADLILDVEPFHGLDIEPSYAIARHIVEVLRSRDLLGPDTAPARDQPAPDQNETTLAELESELAAHYGEIADVVVDIEPFHLIDGNPSRAIARRIIELLDLGEPDSEPD